MSNWRARWIAWRNARISDPRFQRFAADFPLTRAVAHSRARGLFDVVAGFVYSQVLTACIELDLLNALKAAGKTAKSLAAFRKFMASSQSEEEKYIALTRISELFVADGKMSQGLDAIRQAIGMRPNYPDAHIASAKILFTMGRNHEAKDACLERRQAVAVTFRMGRCSCCCNCRSL